MQHVEDTCNILKWSSVTNLNYQFSQLLSAQFVGIAAVHLKKGVSPLQTEYSDGAYSRVPSSQQCGRRVMLAVALALSLLVGSLGFQTQTSHAAGMMPLYSCVSPHCYGTVEWSGGIEGSSTNMVMGSLGCGWCDGFVNNEMWLIDSYEPTCTDPDGGSSHQCWIETLYTTYGWVDHHKSSPCASPPVNCYVWADNRPGGGYHEHPLGVVNSKDYGGGLYLEISETRYGSSSWKVDLSTPSGINYNEASTGNQMYPDDIEIGQELYGTYWASSGQSDYYYNRWKSTGNGSWNYQCPSGSVTSNNPPYGFWNYAPRCNPSNFGGDFRVGAWS